MGKPTIDPSLSFFDLNKLRREMKWLIEFDHDEFVRRLGAGAVIQCEGLLSITYVDRYRPSPVVCLKFVNKAAADAFLEGLGD